MRPEFRFAAALVAILIAAPPARAQSELVIHREGAKEYHWPGCPVIADGRDVIALSRAQANGRGLKPHADCDPARAGSTATTGAAAPRKKAAPVFVQADMSSYYHRDKCAKLGPGSKRMTLEEAGKKLWPCPVCKPPVRRKATEPAVSHRIRR
jgi:hypothetical protein